MTKQEHNWETVVTPLQEMPEQMTYMAGSPEIVLKKATDFKKLRTVFGIQLPQ